MLNRGRPLIAALNVAVIVAAGCLLSGHRFPPQRSHKEIAEEMAEKYASFGQMTRAEAARLINIITLGEAGKTRSEADNLFLVKMMRRPQGLPNSAGLAAQGESLTALRIAKGPQRPLPPELVKEIQGWISVEKIDVYRYAVLTAARVAGQYKLRDLAPHLRALLATSDPEIKWRAAQALRRLGQSAPNVPVPADWKGREKS